MLPAPASPPATRSSKDADHVIAIAGAELVADPAGALYWPEQSLSVVSDLHLEKGSAMAARGVLLPPYDTAATLDRLARLIDRYVPRIVIALGDSFHDGHGPSRLADTDRAVLRGLQRGRDWVWIAGNHDPKPPAGVGGQSLATVTVGPLLFRHEPSGETEGEIAGHLHPVARVARRGRAVSRRCFAGDDRLLVMPAFGAFAGGLNVRNRAFAAVFSSLAFTAHMLGDRRVYAVAAKHCLPD